MPKNYQTLQTTSISYSNVKKNNFALNFLNFKLNIKVLYKKTKNKINNFKNLKKNSKIILDSHCQHKYIQHEIFVAEQYYTQKH